MKSWKGTKFLIKHLVPALMLCMVKGGTIEIVEVEVHPENLEMMVLHAVKLNHGGTLEIILLIFEILRGGMTYLWVLEKSSPDHLENPFIQVMKENLTFVVFINGCIIILISVENSLRKSKKCLTKVSFPTKNSLGCRQP